MDGNIIFTCAMSSTVAVAVITAAKELIVWSLNRKAKLHDDQEESRINEMGQKVDEYTESIDKLVAIVGQLEDKLNISMTGNRVILKDRIKFISLKYIKEKEISMEDKHNVKEMWEIYHYQLGGNGDLDDIMSIIDTLPITETLQRY